MINPSKDDISFLSLFDYITQSGKYEQPSPSMPNIWMEKAPNFTPSYVKQTATWDSAMTPVLSYLQSLGIDPYYEALNRNTQEQETQRQRTKDLQDAVDEKSGAPQYSFIGLFRGNPVFVDSGMGSGTYGQEYRNNIQLRTPRQAQNPSDGSFISAFEIKDSKSAGQTLAHEAGHSSLENLFGSSEAYQDFLTKTNYQPILDASNAAYANADKKYILYTLTPETDPQYKKVASDFINSFEDYKQKYSAYYNHPVEAIARMLQGEFTVDPKSKYIELYNTLKRNPDLLNQTPTENKVLGLPAENLFISQFK